MLKHQYGTQIGVMPYLSFIFLLKKRLNKEEKKKKILERNYLSLSLENFIDLLTMGGSRGSVLWKKEKASDLE